MRWFGVAGRRLPGREVSDPWRVLVLEVMSQQTQIERALCAAEAFCGLFPTPAALATASPADAIRAWTGLGYNRRAVLLHRAAQAIVQVHGGLVPSDVAALEALPGVGPYTARAVASHAFGVPVGPVDVNVSRVLSRLLGYQPSRPELQNLADRLVEPSRPSRWVHAVMDLAAMVCTPRAPACQACPLRDWCRSADSVVDRARPRRATIPFPSTRRWLRGTLIRELATGEPGAWIAVRGVRGTHEPLAVQEAIAHLHRDGLIEVGDGGAVRLSGASTRGPSASE